MAAYELKYTAEEIDGILESVDKKTIYGDATQSEHGLMSTTDKGKLDSLPTSQQLGTSLSGKVDKVNGKGLSTNDYDNTAKAKVDAIPADPKYTDTTYEAGDGISIEGNVISATGGGGGGGDENVIETVKVNGVALTPDSEKAVDVEVPTKTSDLNNDSGFITTETDPTVPSWAKQPNKPSYNYNEIGNTPDLSGFITKSVNDLTNYYLKSETYTKAEVAALIGAIQNFHYEFYASTSAVTNPQGNVLYLIGPTGSGSDRYEEYVYSNNDWHKIGDTSIDLSGYVTTSALNTALADYATTQDLEDSKVFWAEADVTPFADIKDAVDAGRTVLLKDEDGYVYNLLFIFSDYAAFSCASGEEVFLRTYNVYDDDSYELLNCDNFELKSNKETSISLFSDNDHYPSAKAVWNIVSTKYTKPQGGIPASDLESGVIPTVPVQDVTVGGTSVVSNGTAVIPAIPDTSDFEASANKVSTIVGNETDTTKYPNTKAVYDYVDGICGNIQTILTSI